MKKVQFIFATVIVFMVTIAFVGCTSPEQKLVNAQDKAASASQNLNEVEQKVMATRMANAEEWQIFKSETTIKITENESQIGTLKSKMGKSDKSADAIFVKRIEVLEQKNKEMTAKIENFDKITNDWETFKREFNHDMDELGKALKDVTVDNKN